jgi:hypothetical protein
VIRSGAREANFWTLWFAPRKGEVGVLESRGAEDSSGARRLFAGSSSVTLSQRSGLVGRSDSAEQIASIRAANRPLIVRELGRVLLSDMVDLAPTGVHVTLIAHSYGSVLAGLAVRDQGLRAHDLVVLGSSGLGVEHAHQLGLLPGGQRWAARTHEDPVTWLPKLEVHHLDLRGRSPCTADFGARVLRVSGTGHTCYFEDPDRLDALVSIIAGQIR